MHTIQAKSILSAKNGMNLYRGCQHGCIYCDSRSRCYHMDHPFEDVAVKGNALQLLQTSLKRKRRPCMIATGSMSDPYTPVEQELGMTRQALQLVERYGCGIAIQTKSDLILRDLDILRRIHRRSKAVVQITLTAMDDRLSRLIEPNVCPTSRRIEVLKALQAAGIPTVVWLCPVLPWLNDTEENIRGIVKACADAGVKGIISFGMGMTLRDGSREYYYTQLDRKFPGLKERTIRTYGSAYELRSPHSRELEALFHRLCAKYGIWHDNDRIFDWMARLEDPDQLTFFDRRPYEDHDPHGKYRCPPRIDPGAWPEPFRGGGGAPLSL